MKKCLLFITVGFSILNAQNEIPIIQGILDSLVHPELGDRMYSSTPNQTSPPNLHFSQNIGDFDGDGSDDIIIQWGIGVRGYRTDGTYNINADYRYHFGIFSLFKNKYLITGVTQNAFAGKVNSGDFNNDGKIDILVGNKIYIGVNSLSKKKVFP